MNAGGVNADGRAGKATGTAPDGSPEEPEWKRALRGFASGLLLGLALVAMSADARGARGRRG